MDKLSLDKLFPDRGTTPPGNLSVNSLFSTPKPIKPETPRRRIHPFSVDNLIETQNQVERKIQQTYQEVYDLCLEKIDLANMYQKLDLIFEIPVSLYNNPVVSFNDCAEFLIKKLRENHMDVCRLTFNRLFVTWVNIRENKKQAEKQKPKKKSA